MTNAKQTPTRLTDTARKAHDKWDNGSANFGSWLPTCQALPTSEARNRLPINHLPEKERLACICHANLLPTSKTICNHWVTSQRSWRAFTYLYEIAWQCPLTRHCQPRAKPTCHAKVEEGLR